MDGEQAGAPHRAWEAGARARLIAAVIAEVAEAGYSRTSVADICARSGVSPTVFEREFATKQACFLAACQALADALIARVRASLHGTRDWRDGVRAGLDAFLTHLAEHPAAARACMVEGLAAGPEVLAIRDVAMRDFVDLFNAHAPTEAHRSELVSEASVGGVYGIVLRRIRDGDTGALPGLVSALAYFLLAPVVGCPRARLELAGSA
jgi:AcrR family transcriptional regulator